jgi:hypothetical protein
LNRCFESLASIIVRILSSKSMQSSGVIVDMSTSNEMRSTILRELVTLMISVDIRVSFGTCSSASSKSSRHQDLGVLESKRVNTHTTTFDHMVYNSKAFQACRGDEIFSETQMNTQYRLRCRCLISLPPSPRFTAHLVQTTCTRSSDLPVTSCTQVF